MLNPFELGFLVSKRLTTTSDTTVFLLSGSEQVLEAPEEEGNAG